MTPLLQLECNGQKVAFEARRLAAAGYTGRDRAQVQAHIDELAHQGIPAPQSFPTLYEIDMQLLAAWNDIAPSTATVSGEAEAVLIFPTDHLDDAFVSLGSDFTDRVEERASIPRSKQQPKPIGTRVWSYRQVAADWDRIAVRSWIAPGSRQTLYQSGTLSQLLAPPVLVDALGEKLTTGGIAGTILLMGTVPLCKGNFEYSPYFACELEIPSGEILSYACSVSFPSNRPARIGD